MHTCFILFIVQKGNQRLQKHWETSNLIIFSGGCTLVLMSVRVCVRMCVVRYICWFLLFTATACFFVLFIPMKILCVCESVFSKCEWSIAYVCMYSMLYSHTCAFQYIYFMHVEKEHLQKNLWNVEKEKKDVCIGTLAYRAKAKPLIFGNRSWHKNFVDVEFFVPFKAIPFSIFFALCSMLS